MATVFVSHAGADTDTARAVERWLDADDHLVLLDRDLENGIRPGDEWERRLYAWLREADAMVCVVTSDYLTSAWCAAEIGAARTQGCRVLPLAVERGVRHPLLASLQHVDLVDDLDRARRALLDALRRVDATGGVGWPDARSPFPGLYPFDANLRGVFFGRSAEVGELVKILRSPAGRARGLLPVVGPSGCGKSSLVRAGLVPELEGDPEWLTLPPFVPGEDSVGALAGVLTDVGRRLGLPGGVADTRDTLTRDGIGGIAEELLDAAAARRLLVVVDQFEELLQERSRPEMCMDLLRSAADTPVQVVATLRSEFLDLMLDEPGLSVARPFAVRPLGREALRLVVEEPARVAGIEVDSELVARLVDDTGGGEALPLLAFTLAKLAEGVGRGGRLSPERYEQLGGVQGALIEQADTALAHASRRTGRSPAAVVDGLLQLVTVDAQREPTRRWVDLADLSPPVVSELDAFVARRLLTTDQREDGSVHIGVAHEAFLWTWPPIVDAIDGARPALRTVVRIEEKADEWVDAGRRPDWDQLWTGGQLAAAIDTIERDNTPQDRRRGWRRWAPGLLQPPSAVTASRVPLSDDARAFLLASSRLDRTQRQRTTTVLSLLLVVALVASGVTTALWRVSRHQQQATTARQLITLAESLRASDPATAVRLGTAAEVVHPGVVTRSALAASLTSSRFAGALPGSNPTAGLFGTVGIGMAAFTSDGTTMATPGKSIVLWDVARRPPARLSELPETPTDDIAFTPDGRTLVTASRNGTVTLWDIGDRSAPRRAGPVLRLTGKVTPKQYSEREDVPPPDGRGPDNDRGDARSTDEYLPGADREPDEVRLAVSPDDRTLVVAGGPLPAGTAVLIDIADPADAHRLGEPIALGASVRTLEFDRSGRALLAGVVTPGGTASELVVWDVTDRAVPRPGRPSIPYDTAAFAAGRGLLATVNGDTAAELTLWDLTDPFTPRTATTIALTEGTSPEPGTGSDTLRSTLRFSPDASTLAVTLGRWTDEDGWLALWDVAEPGRPRRLLNEADTRYHIGSFALPEGVRVGAATDVTLLAGRRAVAVHAVDGRLTVFDYSDGDLRQVGPPIEPGWGDDLLSVLPDGSAAVSRSGLVWDLTDRWTPRRLRGPLRGDAAVADMVFLDGPRSLAVARQDGSLDRLDLSTADGPASARRLVSPSVPERWAGRSAALDPDARLLAVVQPDGSVTVTDLGDSGGTARIRAPFVPPGQAERTSRSVAFTPGGALVVLSGGALSASGFLTIWDVSDLGSPRLVVSPVESPDLLALSEDGSLAVRHAARTRGVELVDLSGSAGPQRVGEPIAIPHEVGGLAVGLSPDGTVLAVAEGLRGVALWDLTNRSTPRRLPVAITGYTGVPGSLVFSPDGRTLAMTGSTDAATRLEATAREVLLWDVSDPAQPRRLTSSSVIRVGQYAGPIVFSPDSTELATVDPEFAVEIWDITHLLALRDSPRGVACDVAGRGLDQAEWSRFIPGEDFVDICAA